MDPVAEWIGTFDPQLTEAYYPLGQALRKMGKSQEAGQYLALFDRLRVTDKDRAAAQMRQGLAHADAGS